MQGLIGKKVGMTQVFDGDGRRVAVTVLQAGPCKVIQRKRRATDGYDAVQLGFEEQKEQRVTKAARGRFAKAGTAPHRILREFRVAEDEDLDTGAELTAALFDDVEYVDVVGVSKGRGFQGVVKRHRMAGGRMTHGGHSKRRPGAIGQCSYPARVAKGTRLPGHMGHVRVKQQNLRVLQVRGDENLLLVHGAVPGATGGLVLITKALKKAGKSS